MRTKSLFSSSIAVGVAVSCAFILSSAALAPAQTNSGTFSLLVASGFLCDPGESGNCPAVAKSANGDSYEISGAGTFDPQNKAVKAAGTFNHKTTNGNLLETGVWIASDLVSFGSYGAAPTPLLPKRPGFGMAQPGSKRLSLSSGPSPTGGFAVFRILLIPVTGAAKAAELQVNCALGDVPRERSVEGIRLRLEGSATEYSEETQGRVMFLPMRSKVVGPADSPSKQTLAAE